MINCYKSKVMKKYLDDDVYNPHYARHGILLNKHQLVCGATGTGKTNYICNLLSQMDNTFGQICIFTKDVKEPIYQCIKDQLKDKCILETLSKIPYLLDVKGGCEKLFVFDDFLSEGNNTMLKLIDYATLGRKHNITCCFLAQSFYAVPKPVRQNCTYIVLLSMCDKRNLDLIVSTLGIHVDAKLTKQAINNACKFKMNICIIDLLNTDLNRKIRRNFGDYYTLLNDDGSEVDKVELYKTDGLLN